MNLNQTTINKVHCFFEQSGTFKNQFKLLGVEAEDYDINNDFNETDHVIDLFAEIRKGFNDEPSIIDLDRRERGDYFKKPTQYWFVNCEPSHNFIFEATNYNALDCKDAIRMMNKDVYEKTGATSKKVARSMIHPDYANRFIREYIL